MSVASGKTGRALTLSDADISAAAALVKGGGGSITKIAAVYKIHPRTLKRYFKLRGITIKVDKEIVEKVAAAAMAQVNQYLAGGTAVEHARIVFETRDSGRKTGAFLQRLMLKIMMDKVRENIGVETAQNAVKTILMASQILKNTNDVQFHSLGIVNEPIEIEELLPELKVVVMNNEDIKKVTVERESLGDDLGLGISEITEFPELTENDAIVEGENSPLMKSPIDAIS